MNANDIVSLGGIIILGLIGIYFSFKFKQAAREEKKI